MQLFGSAGQATSLMNGLNGAQMAKLNMHVIVVQLMLFLNIMKLSHNQASATRVQQIKGA